MSGIGTYTTTFELPDEWQIAENTEASEGDTESASSEAAKTNSGKIEFQADSFQGGTAALLTSLPTYSPVKIPLPCA